MKYYLYFMLAIACILTFAYCDNPLTEVKNLSSEQTITEDGNSENAQEFIETRTEQLQTKKKKSKRAINPPTGTSLMFSDTNVTKPRRDRHYTQVVKKKIPVTNDTGAITYQSSDEEIATVNNAGVVNFVKKGGTVIITATKAETPVSRYPKSIASYTLTITKSQPQTKQELISEINLAMKAHGNNVDLNYIDTSRITDMSNIFSSDRANLSSDRAGFGLSNFNGDISDWDVSKVTNMSFMFFGATTFNSDLSQWKVDAVTNMQAMFTKATAFNGDISGWNVSKVTNMKSMFSGASSFKGNISSWDVSKVTNMQSMFYIASSFNGNISSWDVSKVTDMQYMFSGATAFNGNISGWDVSSVEYMDSMFYGATNFNTNLDNWADKINKAIKNDKWKHATGMFARIGIKKSLPSWCATEQQCRSSVLSVSKLQ